MLNIKLSNENDVTRGLEKDIEVVKRISNAVDIAFTTFITIALFTAVVICPIMIKL